MRSEIGQGDARERVFEDGSNRGRIGPMLPAQTLDNKAASFIRPHQRFREQRIGGAKELFRCEMLHPAVDDVGDIVAHRIKERLDRLSGFCVHFARVRQLYGTYVAGQGWIAMDSVLAISVI